MSIILSLASAAFCGYAASRTGFNRGRRYMAGLIRRVSPESWQTAKADLERTCGLGFLRYLEPEDPDTEERKD